MINGLSIKDDMTAIRQDLGVCPQFDILWPEITVKEHLMLYAAIKGFSRQQQLQEATDAANNVGRVLRMQQLQTSHQTPAGLTYVVWVFFLFEGRGVALNAHMGCAPEHEASGCQGLCN